MCEFFAKVFDEWGIAHTSREHSRAGWRLVYLPTDGTVLEESRRMTGVAPASRKTAMRRLERSAETDRRLIYEVKN